MKTKVIEGIAVVSSNKLIIKDVQSAIDFIMTVKYETNCNRIALNKSAVIEDFFILSKGLAGEILQKFINYQTKFAIYGDYSKYTRNETKNFIKKMYDNSSKKLIASLIEGDSSLTDEDIEELKNMLNRSK